MSPHVDNTEPAKGELRVHGTGDANTDRHGGTTATHGRTEESEPSGAQAWTALALDVAIPLAVFYGSRAAGIDLAPAAPAFLAVVRGQEHNKTIRAIEYESFHQMAEHQFNLLFDQLEKRWPIESVRLVHRIGRVLVNEPSLWVEVVAPHRGEAFAVCQWLIDEMKRVVPIWKRPVP